jgi:hypothetical protein
VSVCVCVFYLSLTSFDSWPLFLWYPLSFSLTSFRFHYLSFPVECFGGWGKGELGEARSKGPARGGGGGHGRGRSGWGGARRVHYALGSH